MNKVSLDPIPMSQVEWLLPARDTIHVTRMYPQTNKPVTTEVWSRSFVLARLRDKGAFHTGPQARLANHGICSPDASGEFFFFETTTELPKP